MAAELCSQSDSCLETLYFDETAGTAEDGDRLWQTIYDGTITSLKEFTILYEWDWFDNGREECLLPIIAVLNRQTSLQTLKMHTNNLNDDQIQKIRHALEVN